MIDFKLKEVKRFLGKVTELKWQTSYLNYYNNFLVKLVDVICIFTYLYIYIYNQNFWNSHNFPRQHNINKKKTYI